MLIGKIRLALIVCAQFAVSALTCNLINSLRDLTGDRIRADTGSGMTVIEWENLSDGGKAAVDSVGFRRTCESSTGNTAV